MDIVGTSSQLGKKPGSDLESGIITAPALFILERQDAPAKRLTELIKTKTIATEAGREEALTIIRDGGGVEATQKLAERYANEAKDALLYCQLQSSKNHF